MVILSFLIIGLLLGILLRRRKVLLKYSAKISGWSVYLLLFLLGIEVGTNDTIMHNLGSLGAQAIILTIGGISGSIVLSFIVYRYMFKNLA
jgi:uncharacterized membrane protein YbjE (DUF340 family)